MDKDFMIAFTNALPINPDDDPIKINKLDGIALAAPESFWIASENLRAEMVNGCGPGGVGDFFIPDRILGLSIKSACKIHDWMFTIFNDEKGFKLSNQLFLDNMIRINKAKTKNRIIAFLRLRLVKLYYTNVKLLGRPFFYDAHLHLYEDQTIYKKGE